MRVTLAILLTLNFANGLVNKLPAVKQCRLDTTVDLPTMERNYLKEFTGYVGLCVAFLFASSSAAFAVDYAGLDISGQDFSGSNFANRDFSNVVAKGTNFHNANLQGCRFTHSNLIKADFSGADVRGATFQDSTLDGTSFKDANAQRAVFSATILDIADLENVDLTDSIWPSILQVMICDMPELKGDNPVTGVSSRKSVLCRQ